MSYTLLIFGILVGLLVGIDVFVTAFSTQGGGLLSTWIPKMIWKIMLKLSGNDGKRQVLNLSALVITLSLVVSWVFLAWIGNFLIFSSDPWAVIEVKTKLPASSLERFYYSGYILSTMGNGDFTGGTKLWQLYTSFTSFAGFILITSAITYLIPVFTAYMKEQELCVYITSLGGRPLDILINHWNGKDFGKLDSHFSSLANKIIEIGQSHKVYPILFYFHEPRYQKALPLTLASLDEALTILQVFIKKQDRPLAAEINHLRFAINSYLRTMRSGFVKPSESVPPLPEEKKISNSRLPIQNAEERPLHLYRTYEGRRQMLKGLIESKGWQWGDIEKIYRDLHLFPSEA